MSEKKAPPDQTVVNALDAVAVEVFCDIDQRQKAAQAVAVFLRWLPAAWVREQYGLDEAVFVRLLTEAVDEHC